MPGVLVALEGIDGSGKSTQAKLLSAWAEGLGFEVVSTREPTTGKWGRRIRESSVTKRMSARDELAAFVNDRREHVKLELEPALERGAFVIVDRYYYSSVAYQGARGLDPMKVLELNRSFAPMPDAVFLMELEPRVSLARIQSRGAGQDLFESLEALTKAREIFTWLARQDRHVVFIDAAQKPEVVHQNLVFELVRGPLFARMHELASRLKIPRKGYGSLQLAAKLSKDTNLPWQEKTRRLWEATHKTR